MTKSPTLEMVARDRLDRHAMRAGIQPAVLIGQVLGEIMVEIDGRVPGRLEHDGEGGIAGDVDPLERIHLYCNAKRHGRAPRRAFGLCHPCQTFARCRGQRHGTIKMASMRTVSTPSM